MSSVDWEQYWKEEADTYKTINERNQIASKMVGTGKKVLDVGCGHGELMDLLRKDNIVYGIDFTTKMVDDSIKKGLKVIWGEAENIPFPNNHFDTVCALGLIEYLPTDDSFLNEVKRVLKPNGIAIVSFRNALFSIWSGREFAPERRTHNPDKLQCKGFKIEEIVFHHEHFPHKFDEQKFYCSSFIAKLKKV
jgi:ubiquinone/menaquinone biosynthesis C-methylase UbiE